MSVKRMSPIDASINQWRNQQTIKEEEEVPSLNFHETPVTQSHSDSWVVLVSIEKLCFRIPNHVEFLEIGNAWVVQNSRMSTDSASPLQLPFDTVSLLLIIFILFQKISI